jgi:sugar phosphate isomerase/epimerase
MMSTADLGGRVVNGRTTEEEVKRAASEYNKIAEVAMRNGLQQILHNEGFANSVLEDGRLTYPLLLQYLDPNLVKMQFQMSSMNVVGDPIMYFTNHPGRFISAHLQGVNTTAGMRATPPIALPVKSDGAAVPGGRGGRGGGAPVDPCAAPAAPAAGARAGIPGGGGGQALALGEDTADWPKIFAAAKIGGLKYAFIEQGWEQTVKSAAYLKTLS